MKRSFAIVRLVFLIFFVISFLTNILGPLIPDIINSFKLSLGLAGFLPFAFFIAYGVMSIPAGMLLERFREKPVMIAAFAIAFAGSTAVRRGAAVRGRARLSFPDRDRHDHAAGRDQPAAAGGRRRGAFRGELGGRAARLRRRVVPQPLRLLVSGDPLKAGQPADGPLLRVLAGVVPRELPVGVALLGVRGRHGGDDRHPGRDPAAAVRARRRGSASDPGPRIASC